MLYLPDDPLITWLRDGHLGGITLGSSREQALEKWGEPGWPRGRRFMIYRWNQITHRSTLMLSFREGGSLRHLEAVFGETLGFHPQETASLPPGCLGELTGIPQFLDLASANRIDVHWNEFETAPSPEVTALETRAGVNVIFRQGLLHRLIMIPSLALWNHLVLD